MKSSWYETAIEATNRRGRRNDADIKNDGAEVDNTISQNVILKKLT